MATSAADADVLAVCGTAGPELSEAIDRVWEQMPGPRVRVELSDSHAVESALYRAAMQLVEVDRHRQDARERAQSPERSGDHHGVVNHPEHGHMDHSTMNHAGHGHMDHGGHQHNHHSAMDMAPAGIALAEGGDDRDGLEMDVLHVRLGPVLCYWPAGLVVRCSLQGDVLTRAEAWVVDKDFDYGNPPPETGNRAAARYCDHVVDLLALAAWPGAETIARSARDQLLSDMDAGRAASLLDTLHRKLRRSRTLRWSLRDIASLTPEDCRNLELPTALAGDCYDRLLAQVDKARQALANPAEPHGVTKPSISVIDALPHLVSGLDLATARLVIASLGIDTAFEHLGGHHG
ncbi:hypothetical protein ACX9NE_28315 [Mycobacterium sp. ML4]